MKSVLHLHAYSKHVACMLDGVTGVTQMLMGNVCKLTNCIHFRDYKKLFFEFVPEIVFMSCLFGYLVFMIFYK